MPFDDDPFVGGSPLAGALAARYRRPKQHDHVGHMVWAPDPDGVVRRCWCSSCGQEWELMFMPDARGDLECKGWRPILD